MNFAEYVAAAAMLLILAAGVVAMAGFGHSQALVMPVVAAVFLAMKGVDAGAVVTESFKEFGVVALIFTAIAIPSNQLERSGLFARIGAGLGGAIGGATLSFPKGQILITVALALGLTWLTSSFLHNITGIFVMVPIIIAICMSYGVPSRWLLCGALIASNLGGFSLATADTPNIIESKVWGLQQMDFVREIMPLNLIFLVILTFIVTALTRNQTLISGQTTSESAIALQAAKWKRQALETRIDKRLLIVGLLVLGGFIASQFVNRDIEVAAAAIAIVVAVTFERQDERLNALHSLGLDVYLTLISVFVIAHCISHSILGDLLQQLISSTDGAIWAITISSYLGTSLTEAASWANAAAPITHSINDARSAAWALGAGICAGSSSVLTAASAGIILWTESRRVKGQAVTFRDYLPFGVAVSLIMLVFYTIAISIMQSMGL